jgi:hypothetical protein
VASRVALFSGGAILTGLLVLGACSESDEEDASETGDDASGGSLNLDGLGGASAGAHAVISGGGEGNCEIVPDDAGCTGAAYEGEGIPLDIYLMFDMSGSMVSCIDPPRDESACPDADSTATRINAIREATRQFLEDPASAGISVGLGFFGHMPVNSSAESTSCDPADYATPEVTMGMLPGHAEDVVSALEAVSPTGETPTGAAIRGACEYTHGWQDDHPIHKVVQLFITDGNPEAPVTCDILGGTCCPTLDDAVSAASDCLDDSGIETYVLGIGPFLDNLDQVAAAGGTERAYLVSSEEDAAEQVLAALNAIRRDAVIPCDLTVPPAPEGQTLRYDEVNIFHADPACNGSVFGYVEEASNCGERGGWYYDDPDAPSIMKLCPTSCETVGIPGSELVVTVGCETVVEIY